MIVESGLPGEIRMNFTTTNGDGTFVLIDYYA